MDKKSNMHEAEKLAMKIAIEYLEQNNFDREKMQKLNLEFSGGTGLTKDSYSFVLYKLGGDPSDALDFVTVDIDRNTYEYTIIPGTSPELENYKIR